MTRCATGELLTAIRIPGTWAGARFYFEKVRRPATCGTSRWSTWRRRCASSGGTVQAMRIAANGVAARPRRLLAVEQAGARAARPTRPRRWRPAMRAIEGAQPLQHNGYKVPLLRNLVQARDPRVRGLASMDLLTWGRSPWGEWILTHISWDLLWASLFAGVAFLVAHASYLLLSQHRKRDAAETDALEAARPDLPPRITRHSLAARLFHWVMAASMFVLLFTAFLPIAGVQFAWVTWHWTAGLVLTASILFHIVHAIVCDGLLVDLGRAARICPS